MDYQFLIFFAISFVISLLVTPFVRRFALTKNIVDLPSERKIHQKPIARLGGAAVFIAFWLTIVFIYFIDPSRLEFVKQKIIGIDANFLGVILGSLVLAGVGIYDDIKGMKPGYKFIGHILAAGLVVLFGIKIWWVHNPVTGIDTVLGNWTYLIVPFWIVLVINVVNWLDGVDGLASGVGVIAAIVLFALSVLPSVDQPATAALAAVLAGSLLGFLPYNFSPAKIFLGDVGSMFTGFMLAIFAIISGGKFATAALVLGFPILDALWVVARRMTSRQPVWQADRRHLHHRLLDAGLSQKQVVLSLYLLSAIFGVVAILGQTKEKFVALLGLFALALALCATLVILEINRESKK